MSENQNTPEQAIAAARSPDRDLVAGLLGQGEIGAVIGEPGSFKSTLTVGAGRSVAQGSPFLGREVLQGGVLVAELGEGRDLWAKVRAWDLHYGVSRNFAPFSMVAQHGSIVEGASSFCVEALVKEIEQAKEVFAPTPLRLVVVDTPTDALGGADENGRVAAEKILPAIEILRGATYNPDGTYAAMLAILHSQQDAAQNGSDYEWSQLAPGTRVVHPAGTSSAALHASFRHWRKASGSGGTIQTRTMPGGEIEVLRTSDRPQEAEREDQRPFLGPTWDMVWKVQRRASGPLGGIIVPGKHATRIRPPPLAFNTMAVDLGVECLDGHRRTASMCVPLST